MEVLTVIKKTDRKKRFWKWNSSFKNYQSLYFLKEEKADRKWCLLIRKKKD